jgi:hypothetical protein
MLPGANFNLALCNTGKQTQLLHKRVSAGSLGELRYSTVVKTTACLKRVSYLLVRQGKGVFTYKVSCHKSCMLGDQALLVPLLGAVGQQTPISWN